MPNFTLKNIPQPLYERLKQAAAAHRRSLNSEILVCIERTLGGGAVAPEEWLARARALRRDVGPPLTDAAVTAAKRQGRR